jgi:hypothetical protein
MEDDMKNKQIQNGSVVAEDYFKIWNFIDNPELSECMWGKCSHDMTLLERWAKDPDSSKERQLQSNLTSSNICK